MRIGVDLGGTKIEVVVLDNQHNIIDRKRSPTPSQNYTAIISEIKELIDSCVGQISCHYTIGIGIPGILSATTGLVKNANLQCLIGKPFDRDLSTALESPVKISNDANCFTLSEAVDGAAKGYRTVFGVIIGTGTGGGIVINGNVLSGKNSIAGEWGHNPLPWPNSQEIPGQKCYCGKFGCIETFLSGSGMVFDYHSVSKKKITTEEIVKLAENDNLVAKNVLYRYIDRLARSLAMIINVLDPDVIVLGGGLSNISSLYHEIPDCWGQYIFSNDVKTLLKQAEFGDSSGVRGAAWLWN